MVTSLPDAGAREYDLRNGGSTGGFKLPLIRSRRGGCFCCWSAEDVTSAAVGFAEVDIFPEIPWWYFGDLSLNGMMVIMENVAGLTTFYSTKV